MTEKVFYLNKKKLIFILTCGILIILLGIFILLEFFGTNWELLLFHIIPINRTVLGIGLIAFFSILSIPLIKKIKDDRPGLIINKQGIIDNSSYTSVGDVNWKEIIDSEIRTISGQKMILLKVKNAQIILDGFPSGMRKKIIESSSKINGTPVVIAASSLKGSFEEIYDAIKLGIDTNKSRI